MRYTAAVAMRIRQLRCHFDAFEFHRIEPALLFLQDPRPKNAFFHQDMTVIRSDKADIVWRHMPWMYFTVERWVVQSLSSAWCVRQAGVRSMHERFPYKADAIRFVPTWVDTAVFSPIDDARRQVQRRKLALELSLDIGSVWVVSVGRLDSQKDPALLLDAVARLAGENTDLNWLVVGDGVLRASLEQQVASAGIGARVRFLGLMAPTQIAELLQVADVFALSSAYEGMPMAVLEALGSGVPVATTDVGEVRQVVKPGINGEIASERSAQGFAKCLGTVIARRSYLRGDPAVQAIQAFQPEQVLAPVFANYRRLAGRQDGTPSAKSARPMSSQ
ncbi:MAG: glycosyltransferase [Rhodanobacteraceae bacterium]|nr:glycosyltransferase [Rhodanobacteraceae bacterium]